MSELYSKGLQKLKAVITVVVNHFLAIISQHQLVNDYYLLKIIKLTIIRHNLKPHLHLNRERTMNTFTEEYSFVVISGYLQEAVCVFN